MLCARREYGVRVCCLCAKITKSSNVDYAGYTERGTVDYALILQNKCSRDYKGSECWLQTDFLRYIGYRNLINDLIKHVSLLILVHVRLLFSPNC